MDSKSIQIEIPKNVKTLLERLNKNGYEAYIVGGCVRDSLLSMKFWRAGTRASPPWWFLSSQ